jgi:hypothetical protein
MIAVKLPTVLFEYYRLPGKIERTRSSTFVWAFLVYRCRPVYVLFKTAFGYIFMMDYTEELETFFDTCFGKKRLSGRLDFPRPNGHTCYIDNVYACNAFKSLMCIYIRAFMSNARMQCTCV